MQLIRGPRRLAPVGHSPMGHAQGHMFGLSVPPGNCRGRPYLPLYRRFTEHAIRSASYAGSTWAIVTTRG